MPKLMVMTGKAPCGEQQPRRCSGALTPRFRSSRGGCLSPQRRWKISTARERRIRLTRRRWRSHRSGFCGMILAVKLDTRDTILIADVLLLDLLNAVCCRRLLFYDLAAERTKVRSLLKRFQGAARWLATASYKRGRKDR